MTTDLFVQINQTVLDLQAAELQTFERPLKRLGQLLGHPELAAANAILEEGVDLPAFLAQSERTGRSMAGSHRLAWPDDPVQQLGLSLLLIKKLADKPDEAWILGHTYFNSSRKIIDGVRALTAQLIIPFVRDYKAFVLSRGNVETRVIRPKGNKVFVVHGHDGEAREAVARFISTMGMEPVILHEQASRGQTIMEKVVAHSEVDFAVVLLTPDDEGRSRGASQLEPRARQNVLLELGYFIGRLGRGNVCALKRGTLESPAISPAWCGPRWMPRARGGKRSARNCMPPGTTSTGTR